jgi:hypothetical protein
MAMLNNQGVTYAAYAQLVSHPRHMVDIPIGRNLQAGT